MSRFEQRLQRLEASLWQRRPTSHHIQVVRLPWTMEPDDQADYLASLPCPCGVHDCQQRTLGLLVPAPLPSDAWQAQAQAYYAERRSSP